jgi:fructan beta-fructosidase
MNIHFSPPSGWMNDPNGLIYFDGEWHLFYQHIPDGDTRQYWGHAVSRDLQYWEHLPIALAPDGLGSIWSGCVVLDEHDTSGFFDGAAGLVAVFTHQNEQSQRQSLAYSHDRGRTWTKYPGNPVLTSPNPDFRDPKVFWHTPTNRWIMLVTCGDCVQFYHSPDLKHWSYLSSFGQGWISPDWTWECPDLFTLALWERDGVRASETYWVLHASFVVPSVSDGHEIGPSKMRYFIGQFDGDKFIPHPAENQPGGHPTSYGADDYAGILFANAPQEERIFLAWMSHWAYAWPAHHQGKREQMTLPRRLSLRRTSSGLRLFQEPLHPWLQVAPTFENLGLENENLLLSEQTGQAFAIAAEIEVGTAEEVGFILRKGRSLFGGAQQTVVGYDAAHQIIFVDRTQAGDASFHPHFAARHEAPLALAEGRLKIKIFVDACSVEVFAADGDDTGDSAVLTDLIFPDANSQDLETYARGGKATFTKLGLAVLTGIRRR